MEPEEYLSEILKNQTFSDDSDELKLIRDERDSIEEIIKLAFEDCHPKIRYGGSIIKHTMIKVSYDLDITSYFPHDDDSAGESLEDIYTNMWNFLSESYYVEPKKSALRLKNKNPEKYKSDFHIDVVPGRFVDDSETDAYLYQNEGEKKWLKTNLDKHIKHIRDSGLNNVIRLIKYWNFRYGLQIKTFPLELLVVKYSKKSTDTPLTTGLTSFWERMKELGENIAIEDPANPGGNDLSPIFGDTERQLLKTYSDSALKLAENNSWSGIFGESASLSETEKAAKIFNIGTASRNIPKPWSDRV